MCPYPLVPVDNHWATPFLLNVVSLLSYKNTPNRHFSEFFFLHCFRIVLEEFLSIRTFHFQFRLVLFLETFKNSLFSYSVANWSITKLFVLDTRTIVRGENLTQSSHYFESKKIIFFHATNTVAVNFVKGYTIRLVVHMQPFHKTKWRKCMSI